MADLIIRIGAEAKEFQAEVDKVVKQTKELEAGLDKVAVGSTVAYAAITAGVGIAVAAYASQQNATNILTQALENQGLAAQKLIPVYREYAEQIEHATGLDAEQITLGQAKLQSMIGQIEVTEALTRVGVEFGNKLGDISQGFEVLGKGIQGQTKGLKTFGIEVEEGLSKQERLAKILEVASQKLDGQAAAATQGLGAVKILHVYIEDLEKFIGARFAPSIEAMTQTAIGFFKALSENKPLLGFIADNVKLAAEVAGATAVITGLVLGFIKLRQGIEIASVAMKAFGITSEQALIRSGIGIAIVALTEAFIYYSNKTSEGLTKATQSVRDHSKEVDDLKAKIKALSEEQPQVDKFSAFELEMYKKQKETRLRVLRESLANEEKLQKEFDTKQDALDAKKELADKENKIATDKDRRKIESLKAANAVLVLEANDASQATIALAKQEADLLAKIEDDKNAKIRDQLREKLEETRTLRTEQNAIDAEQRVVFEEEILAKNQEYQALEDDQKALFRLRNEQALRSQLETERSTNELYAKQKVDLDVKTRNTFLLEQQKYGTAVATFDQAMNSTQVQAAKGISGELVQLAQSKNETLKAIGKAAAITSIVVNTAASAVTLTKQIQDAIPFPFSVPVIAALVGARIAFGAEQLANVQGAASGALVEGGVSGRDSVPFLLEPGELVTPRRNFDEVVNAVADQRNGGGQLEGGSGEASPQLVAALESINEKLSQPANNYHFHGDVLADDTFIDAIGRRLSDRVQNGNLNLIASRAGA